MAKREHRKRKNRPRHRQPKHKPECPVRLNGGKPGFACSCGAMSPEAARPRSEELTYAIVFDDGCVLAIGATYDAEVSLREGLTDDELARLGLKERT